MESLITASDAAARLGVSVKTLYAYVSRGLVHSAASGDPHKRRYRSADIEALLARKRLGKRPSKIAESALHWGIPALESDISTISDGRLLYRGQNAIEFGRRATLEETARLLWNCGDMAPFATPSEFGTAPPRIPISSPIAQCSMILNASGANARPIWGRPGSSMWPEAAQLTRLVAAGLLGTSPSNDPLHLQLARAWKLNHKAAELIRTALVLIADHELNTSTFTVRVIASTGASLASCITGGLAALSGPLHGGAIFQVDAFLARLPAPRKTAAFIRAMLDRGEMLPGFGHRLYPSGDPRAEALLKLLPSNRPRSDLLEAIEKISGLRPNVDYAFFALTRALRLPVRAAQILFATGRTTGWIAHALEQNAQGHLIRPRARSASVR
jgi:citrate synthase